MSRKKCTAILVAGVFDFASVEGLIRQAEANQVKLVLLWLAPWKNSTSSYAPPYIKHEWQKYAKAQAAFEGQVPQALMDYLQRNRATLHRYVRDTWAAKGGNAFYAIGELDGMGFSPFHIETLPNPKTDPLTDAYRVLRQIAPLVLGHQGKGSMRGFKAPLSAEGVLDETPRKLELAGHAMTVTMVDSRTPKSTQQISAHGGLIMQTGKDEFLAAGRGVIVRFADAAANSGFRVGIEQVVEGEFVNGQWVGGRWLNGDESGQGRYLRLPPEKFGIQKIKVYRYK